MFCSNCGKEIPQDAKFCPECGHPAAAENEKNKQIQNSKTDLKENNINDIEKIKQPKKKLFNGFLILLICIGVFYAVFSPDTTTPREPKNLECINYGNLCIATTDVKYDYTAVKTRTSGYPAYNKEWNNGWAAAQNACKAWGGRLPYMEEFATIVDAYNQNKIKLEDYKTYLSNTQINTYRIWAYSHHKDFAKNGYNAKNIYDSAISIEKSGDHIITGHYDTSIAYTWNARCVKEISSQNFSINNKANMDNNIINDKISSQKDDLYKIWDKNNITFINKRGKKVFSFPINKYDMVGNFFDGVLFVGNIIEGANPNKESFDVLKLYMLDNKGKLIKDLPYSAKFNTLDHLPIMYNGIAKIYTGTGLNEFVYINRQGREIPVNEVSKNVDNVISSSKFDYTIKKVNDGYGDPNVLQYITHTPDNTKLNKRSVRCGNNLDFLFCAEYVDSKGDVVIKKQFTSKLDNFYNGYILVTSYQDNGGPQNMYINSNGEILKNEKYDWAEPFTRDLAFVQQGEKYGYIDTKGNWIWNTICSDEENCIFMYLGQFDSIKTYLNPPVYTYED